MASTGARLNQGKSSNARKSSRPSTSNQKPCREMLVTSASEVTVPGICDLLLVLLDQLAGTPEILRGEAVASRQFDFRIEPELRLAVSGRDVDVQPRFLAGEEEEPEGPFAEHRWAHPPHRSRRDERTRVDTHRCT